MVWMIKWVLGALALFAIYTASPQERAVMYDGGVAFGSALFKACTRDDSPCTIAIAAISTGAVSLLNGWPSADTARQPDRHYQGRLDRPPKPYGSDGQTFYRN